MKLDTLMWDYRSLKLSEDKLQRPLIPCSTSNSFLFKYGEQILLSIIGYLVTLECCNFNEHLWIIGDKHI